MKKSNYILIFLFSIFTIYTLINIKETNASTMNVLITFSKTILPALLPFLIINQLLIKLGIIDLLAYFLQFISYPLFKISGRGASIIIISLLNGFPSSAIFTSLMVKNNQLPKEEGQRIINSIFFPSLSFLFVIINTNINNLKYFSYLIISIYLISFTLLYISSFKIQQKTNLISFSQTTYNIKNKLNNFIFVKELKDIISYAFSTLTCILGVIVLFSIPCNLISKIANNDYVYLLQGLIEFSMPSIKLSLSPTTIKNILSLSIILSFSSISSIMQAMIFIQEANLNKKSFVLNRILVSIITPLILYLFLSLL